MSGSILVAALRTSSIVTASVPRFFIDDVLQGLALGKTVEVLDEKARRVVQPTFSVVGAVRRKEHVLHRPKGMTGR